MHLLKNFSIFSFFTLFSRVCGFVRDMLIAYCLGASVLTDIFFTSLKLPNLFRSLFAEGAFTLSFVPLYGVLLKKDTRIANRLLCEVFSVLFVILIILTILFEINMGFIISIFAPGFKNSSHFDLLVLLGRIMFPYIILVSIVALASGALQAVKKFSALAISPIILNLAIIVATLCSMHKDGTQIVINLALSVIIAGFLQVSIMLFHLSKNGIELEFKKIQNDENLYIFFKRILPISFSACIYQLNIFVDTFFASSVTLGVSYLYYADRVNQLPLSLIGVSLGTVVLPLISEAIHSNDVDSALNHQNKALEIALILAVPASVSLFLLADIIIRALFMNSVDFGLNAAIETAKTLKIFSFALPAYVLNKIFLTTFFASGDTKSPMIFATISLIINIVLNFFLIGKYQHLGIAIASTISAWINTLLILYTLRRRGLFKITSYISDIFSQVFFSTSVLIFIIEFLRPVLSDVFVSNTIINKLIIIVFIAIVGAFMYFATFFIVKRLLFRKRSY